MLNINGSADPVSGTILRFTGEQMRSFTKASADMGGQ